jgi:hypothetical protein
VLAALGAALGLDEAAGRDTWDGRLMDFLGTFGA